MRIYKLRNKDGLFSSGGSSPVFTEKGKMWHGIGHVKLHLNSLLKYEWRYKTIPEDWEIVAYDLVESESINAKESYESYYFEKKEEEEQRIKASRKQYIKNEIKRLEALKKELENG